MSKKALFNFSTDGVQYEKGKIYSDEETKHLDPSNFEQTEVEANAAAIDPNKEMDTEEKDETEAPSNDGAGEKKEDETSDQNGTKETADGNAPVDQEANVEKKPDEQTNEAGGEKLE